MVAKPHQVAEKVGNSLEQGDFYADLNLLQKVDPPIDFAV
jgi:hypothetical protein